ncbi:hypothetical protein ACSLN1_26325, partial [Escherichia coli]|uniref:hypothetical protein n=1 Tax=Escherichia coli TaxID=562 RepID=UPI003EE30E99
LACSLQKYNNPETFADSAKNKKLTCVFLDKDRGAELCIRMLGVLRIATASVQQFLSRFPW